MSYKEADSATFTEMFVRNFNILMSDVHTTMPGVIETYDGNRICSVKPSINRKLSDGTFLPLPIIAEAPVMFPGGPDFGMTWPLSKGTPVLIHICERSIEDWLQNGLPASPEDLRRFSLTDAVVEPGLYHKGGPFPAANNTDFQILYKQASLKITEDGTIALNGNEKSFVTYAELDAALQLMKTSIEASTVGSVNAGILAHTHVETGTTTAPGVGSIVSAAPPVTVDISASETTTIKTGG